MGFLGSEHDPDYKFITTETAHDAAAADVGTGFFQHIGGRNQGLVALNVAVSVVD